MTKYQYATVDGDKIFYREAGPKTAPTILLLHGFPTSSHMFRNLIPALSDPYHVVAPDLPGFGFSDAPDRKRFRYTFEHVAEVIDSFTQAIGLDAYAIYLFDYGAPVGLRLALAHPDKIYACRPDRKSARPLRTVELLAETLSLEVDTRFGNDEEAALAAEADQAEGTVLICWKHEALPRLAERLLGNASELPAEWPADRFDMTWIFDRKPSAAGWIFSQVPQLLFPGDSVEPFPSRSQ